MPEYIKFIDYLTRISDNINLIIKKIDKNIGEVDDQDRETIRAIIEAFIKTEK